MPEEPKPLNYFNYFTEVEEHFQRARATGLFLMSPLDWALIESWKSAGVPLEAVQRGIDAAFEKARSRKGPIKRINSLAYCTQAVTEEAAAIAKGLPQAPAKQVEAPFTSNEVREHLLRGAAEVRKQQFAEAAAELERLAAQPDEALTELEDLEQRLTAIEEHILGVARGKITPEQGYEHRRELDQYLKPYRSKFTADQLARLERQYLDRRLFETFSLPRLSLFYVS